MKGKRIRFFLLAVFVCATTALASNTPSVSTSQASAASAKSLSDRVVEDTPGRLALELSVPDFSMHAVGGAPGQQVSCSGCLQGGIAGSPDLPAYRFDVLSGPAAPQVTMTILESESRLVPDGLAPVPQWLTPTKAEYRVTPESYARASALSSRDLGLRYMRAAPIRGLEVPLALWSETGKTLTLIKRLRVEIVFSGVSGRPSTYRLDPQYLSLIKNPVGGAYLYSSPSAPARSTLRKTGSAKAGADAITMGSRFLKIKIGDRNVENLDEDRVYGLSFGDLVHASADLNSGIKIEDLKIYTGGNDTLPRTMTGAILPGTLREIPIEVVDGNHNGTFDEQDSIRFFGHGSSVWKRIPGNRGPIRYEFGTDPYSFENYYFLDYSHTGHAAPRLAAFPSLPAKATVKTSSYAYLRAEKDAQTAACDPSGHKDEESGYLWFWYWKGGCDGSDSVVNLSRSQLASDEVDSLPDLDQGMPKDSLYVGIYVARLGPDSSFKVFYGPDKDTLDVLRLPPQDSNPKPQSAGSYYVWTGPVKTAPAFHLEGVRWARERRFVGYTVSYRRKYVFSGKPVWIFPSDFGKPVTYKVQGGEGLNCIRVEDGVATGRMILDGQGAFTDSLGPNADAKYFIYRGVTALPAANIETEALPSERTAIRDLLTGDKENPEYLIITAKPLLPEALKLKDYRNDPKRALNLRTSVVRVEDIYRQFSSGRMSPVAIRDFLRYAYRGWDQKLSTPGALKYVLFYGDGHYDYRNIKAIFLQAPPPNFIPPYEFFGDGHSEEIASEDFYAALDSTDNDPEHSSLDISIGRLPIQNLEQASAYLQKIMQYEDPSKAGEWRGRVAMAADDATQRGNPNDLDLIRSGHTTDADNLGKDITANEPGVTVDKIYLLDYPMNSSFHKPEAAQDLLALINRGTLMVNYVGHGASNQWADEVLLQTNDALSRMHNEGRTPMVNAFSCTVGRFESLTSEGMSEQFVKQPRVGAIGAISATRESFPTENIRLAAAFYKRAFPVDSLSDGMTVGRALQEAKNSSETDELILNDAKYALLGEPVLLMRKPKLGIQLQQAPDTIKALDCNTIKGRITGGSGSGFVSLKIVAGSIHKVYELPAGMTPQVVDKRGNILFEQTFPYHGNSFSVDYFIPKQIPFGDSTAQILLFAWDGSQEREGTMAKQNLRIVGTAASACATDSDGKGPRIKITGCQTKETGDVDFPNRVKLSLPYCLQIQVEDSSGGVLTAEGPDQGTTMEIPGILDPFHPQPGIDELYLKRYQITLDKKTIQPGQHLLKVSARDGYGNLSSRQLAMELTVDSSLNTVSAYNVPNPMKRNGTTFYFSTVLPAAEVDFSDPDSTDRVNFEIRIFNQSGYLVKQFRNAKSGSISWDGHDDYGQLLANGVYFYNILARQNVASLGGARPGYRTLSSKRNTLVISR